MTLRRVDLSNVFMTIVAPRESNADTRSLGKRHSSVSHPDGATSPLSSHGARNPNHGH
jgi:hypothetical protein